MIIESLEVGPLMANCYILVCEETKEGVIIDPGGDPQDIMTKVDCLDASIKYVINTHGHFDHTAGNQKVKEATGAPLLIHEADAPMLPRLSDMAMAFGISSENSPAPDQHIKDGDEIKFGNVTLKVLHTPGHSPGGVALYANGAVFSGDTLFFGSIGRHDLPGGNFHTLIASIKNKLFPLGDDTKVYSGHGPATSIGREKQFNPYCR